MKNQTLIAFANELKEKGYTVIVPEKQEYNWFHVFKEGKMASVSYEGYGDFGSFSLSSEHIPCKEHGTGLGVHRDLYELNESLLQDALNAKGWHGNIKRELWKSPEAFINSTHAKWANYSIL